MSFISKTNKILSLIIVSLFFTSSFCFGEQNDGELINITGVLSLSNTSSYPSADQLFYKNSHERIINSNQQQLRIISEGNVQRFEYEFHATSTNQHSNTEVFSITDTNLYRAKSLSHSTISESTTSNSNQWIQSIDRAAISTSLSNITLNAGRRPISWGAGRFWQPLDLFGAFAATDLEREYKPGIDQISASYYPSYLSSFTLLYVFSPIDNPLLNDSQGAIYQTQFGASAAASFMLSNISGNPTAGFSVETDWLNAGWRLEGIVFEEFDSSQTSNYFIAGFDYQFENETFMSMEYYYNSSGATNKTKLQNEATTPLVLFGLQKQLSQQLLGVSLQNTITPLITANYTMLAASFLNTDISTLHQLSGIISLSDESDLRLSILLTQGDALDKNENIQSEFGHIPASGTLKYRHYF